MHSRFVFFLSPLRTHFCDQNERPCGLMDKALVFGTKDCRFESCQGHVEPYAPAQRHLADFAVANGHTGD